MLIRSQNRKQLCSFEGCAALEIIKSGQWKEDKNVDAYKIILISTSDAITLGEYSSEEKAMKVLDKINDTYSSYMRLEGGPTVVGGYIQPNYWVLPKTYQMPEDSEVKA